MKQRTCYLLLATCYLLVACTNPYMLRDLQPIIDAREGELLDDVFYTVVFDSMGGSTVPSQTVEEGGVVLEPPNRPTRDGFSFGGWYKEAACINIWDFAVDSVTEDITLYARWEEIVFHTVTFDLNGGSGTAHSDTVEYGSLITEPFIRPIRDGFSFGGWYKEAACINIWDFAVDTVTSDITLYARWVEGGTVSVSLSVEEIIDIDIALALITVSRTESGGLPATANVSVDPADYDAGSIRWEITGTGAYAGEVVSGTGASFTIDATDVRYNTVGGHSLVIEVAINGIVYRRNILFTVTN